MGVNGVDARLEPNKRIGFAVTGKWKVVPLCGEINPADIKLVETESGQDVIPYEESLFQALVDYDTALNTVGSREKFIRLCLEKPMTNCYVARDNGIVIGYGIIQPAIRGNRIAPLYCDSPNLTRLILKKLLQSVPAKKPLVNWYTPDCNPVISELINEWSLDIAWSPMYRQFTKYDLEKIACEKVFATFGCETCFV
jgi:hypothetical protein